MSKKVLIYDTETKGVEQYNVVMNLVETFLEETDYKIKPIDREIEVEDMLEVDRETGKVINYGSINDIINTEEFKQWFKLKLEKGAVNEFI